MINVLWVITRLIPGGTRRLFLWMLEILRDSAFKETSNFPIRVSIAAGPDGVDDELRSKLSKINIPFYEIPHLYRNINPLYDWLAFKDLRSLMQSNKFDIVHTHTSKAGYLGRLAAKHAGVSKVIHTPHGHIFNNFFGGNFSMFKTELAVILERQAALWCDSIIALSKKEKEDYEKLKICPLNKIEVIYNGLPSYLIPEVLPVSPISGSATPLRGSSTQEDLTLSVGFLGRLVPEKGVSILLKAVSNISRDFRFPDIKLVIGGDGPLRSILMKESIALGIENQTIFLGSSFNPEEFWNAITLFVLPSHSEGFGLALLEAMAHGKCVIATNAGGIPEVVEDGVTGVLVPPNRPELLADAIIKLFNAPSSIKTMGFAGWHSVKTRFKLEDKVKQLLAFYS